MTLNKTELPIIYLRSGEMYFTDQPSMVMTVLGSCVSVTMFHRHLGLSAISHGVLPYCRNRRTCDHGCVESAKYVECALRAMVDRFKQTCVALHELESRIYGGADMFGALSKTTSLSSVGKQNIEMAVSMLEQEGVQVFALDVGGNQGRKIYFNTQTGDVQLIHLPPTMVLAGNGGNGKVRRT